MKRRNEGFIKTNGGKVWYEIVGKSKSVPLITLHGGPGYPHDSLEPLEDLAGDHNVIFYDQLGCGNSEWTTDKSLWTVKYFVSELGQIIKALGLKQYHIIGQSWGAALGTAFALTEPEGLKSLILTDAYLGTPSWEKDAKKLLQQLPAAMRKALLSGKTKTKEYKKASDEFYYRHVFRMRKLPTGSIKAHNKMNGDIYNYMWGPEEFEATGTLKKFDLSGRLHEIKVPVLLLCGRFDEATPETTEYFKNQIPNAQMKIFEKSAHMPMWTERKEYIKTIRNFLNQTLKA